MSEKKIDTLGNISQYIAVYYFIIVTMITVGYGDFYPVNFINLLIKNKKPKGKWQWEAFTHCHNDDCLWLFCLLY